MKKTISVEQLYEFYRKYPQHIGKLYVDTQYGYKKVNACEITAIDSPVYLLETITHKKLKSSPDHLVLTQNNFKKISELVVTKDTIKTINGYEKILQIKKLKYKDDLYDLDVSDVHEYYTNNIVSHNSSIIDSIFFCIYGETIKKLKKEEIVNWITKKNCLVTLEFSIDSDNIVKNYKIIRGIAPSKLEFWIDGENKSRTMNETTEDIYKILNTSGEMFEQSITLSLNDTEPFLAKKPVVKKKFIEGIFDLNVFSEMFNNIREDMNQKLKIKTAEEIKLNELNLSLEKSQKDSEIFEANKVNTLKTAEDKKAKLNNDIIKTRELIRTVDYESAKAQIKEKLDHLTDASSQDDGLIETKNTEIKTQNKVISDNTIKISKISQTNENILAYEKNKKDKLDDNVSKKTKTEKSIADERSLIKEIDFSTEKDNYIEKNKQDSTKVSETKKTIEELKSQISQIYNIEIRDINKTLIILADRNKDLNNLKGSCAYCKRPYTENDLQQYQEDIKKNEELILSNKTKLKEFNELVAAKECLLTSEKANETRLTSIIEENHKELVKLEKKEDSIKNDNHSHLKMIRVYEDILSETNKEIDKISKQTNPFCLDHSPEEALRKNKEEIEVLEHINGIISSEITELEKSIASTKTKKTELNKKLDLLRGNLQEIEKMEDKIRNDNFNHLKTIDLFNSWLVDVDASINKLNTEANIYSDTINVTKNRIDGINVVLSETTKSLKILENAKFIVSEEGVKSYIIKKMLTILNSRLNYYLVKLEAPGMISFDEYFNEKIVTTKGLECSYFNFSGGERKRVDLAMLFTFLDMRRLCSNVTFNITFYDELLDCALDSKGVEKALLILKERMEKYNEGIYIISHKQEAIKHVTGDIIFLQKENGITRRIVE